MLAGGIGYKGETYQCHDDEDGKGALRENASLQANVLPKSVSQSDPRKRGTHQDDKFDETLATHKSTNGEALAPEAIAQSSGEGAADNLAEKGAGNNGNHIAPGLAIIEQAKVGVQT